MFTKFEKKSLLKALAASTCGVIITLTSMTATSSATTSITPETGNCLFSAQLSADPALKAEFTTKIFATRLGAITEDDNELIYETSIPARSNVSFSGSTNGIDRLSNDCLSCHDGVMAQNFKLRVKNNPGGSVMNLEDIIGGHPVGMEYDNYAAVDTKGYKKDVKFSTGMVFSEGRVGCLTCHNPLNTEKGHLVMNNDKSELCFACHNK